MYRAALVLAFATAAAATAACGNSYHPEYHPVSVNQVEQNLSYPVTVQTGSQPAPVYVMPAPPPAGVAAPAHATAPPPPTGYDPSDFFNH